MGRLQEILNLGKTFEFEGKKYSLQEANIEQRGEFAAWVESNAVEYIYRMQLNDREGRFDAFVDKMLIGHKNDVAAGKFEWGGEVVLKATQSRFGTIKLLYILLNKDHPEVTEEVAEYMVNSKYKEIGDKIKEAFSDPKASAELEALKDILRSYDS